MKAANKNGRKGMTDAEIECLAKQKVRKFFEYLEGARFYDSVPQKDLDSVRARFTFLSEPPSFADGLAELDRKGYRIASAEEVAWLKYNDRDTLDHKGFVREAYVFFPSGKIRLTRKSPILARPYEAVEAYKRAERFTLTDSEIEEVLQDSIVVQPHVLIKSTDFLENEVMKYAFGKNTALFGYFLHKIGMPSIRMDINEHDHSTSRPYALQASFWGPDLISQLLQVPHELLFDLGNLASGKNPVDGVYDLNADGIYGVRKEAVR